MENNKTLKLILIAGIVVFLGGNVLMLQREASMDWQKYQRAYLDKVIEKTTDPKLKEEFMSRSPRIEQLIITGFGEQRVDRCMTCHVSINDPRFKNEQNPFRTHPRIPGNHSFDKFGCTICHDGNGRGLSVKDAHGEIYDWTEPLLQTTYIQSNCGKCHPYPYLKDTPLLSKGRELFKSKGCYGCHRIDGISKGSLGIHLTTVGAKRTTDFMIEKIKKPRVWPTPESVMPVMPFKPDELTALVVFLKSQKGEYLNLSNVEYYVNKKNWNLPQKEQEYPVTEASGKNIFENKSCTTCHTINAVGGLVGPDLSVVGLRRSREWHIQHLTNPRSLVIDSIMPGFTYSQSELEALTMYLVSLKELNGEAKKIIGKKYSAMEK